MIDSIKSWFSQNKGALVLYVAAVGFLALCLSLGGCSLGDVISRQVPLEMRRSVGAPSAVSLNEAPIWMAKYQQHLQSEYDTGVAILAAFDQSVNEGWELVGLISGGLNLGIGAAVTGVPGGAPLGAAGFGLLTFFAGLFTKGPGTSKEKEKSFNKGYSTAVDAFKAAGLTLPEKA